MIINIDNIFIVILLSTQQHMPAVSTQEQTTANMKDIILFIPA